MCSVYEHVALLPMDHAHNFEPLIMYLYSDLKDKIRPPTIVVPVTAMRFDYHNYFSCHCPTVLVSVLYFVCFHSSLNKRANTTGVNR